MSSSGPNRARDLAAIAWVEVADLLDLQLSPLGLHAIDALSPEPGEAVLDLGCGAGQTVLQLADRVGPGGRVVGVDIARPLLEVARLRAAGRSRVDFIEFDAGALALPERGFDCVYSRFGVMAFPGSGSIRATLQKAGFRQITIQARDEKVSSGDLDAMIKVLLRVGSLGKIIRENPNLRAAAESRVRAALTERGHQAAVALNAATWVVTARS